VIQTHSAVPYCESLQVHRTETIQPSAVFVGVDPKTLEIRRISANCSVLFGPASSELLGASLSRCYTEAALQRLRRLLEQFAA